MMRRLAALVAAAALSFGLMAPAAGLVPSVAAAPGSAVDQTKVPHYFGPYANWANSPLTLPDATVTIGPAPVAPINVGNPVIARTYASDDTAATSGAAGQGTVLVILPNALPAGTLLDFQTFTQNAGNPLASPGNVFNAYVLHPTGNPGEYSVVYDSGPLTVPVEADAVHTWLAAGSPAVAAGDLIGFYGQGIPLDITAGTDGVYYPSPAAPAATFVVNGGGFPTLAGPRTYSFAADVMPAGAGAGGGATATATVGANGAVTGLTITNPGGGYTAAPSVAITGAGTGATATAVVQTSSAVTSVTINAAGGGYTAPSVVLTGSSGTGAAAHALSGVDAVNVSVPGSGYKFPVVDFDLPDDPTGLQAQGHAVCAAPYADCNLLDPAAFLTVTGVIVDNPGSGYFTAPGVAVRDGTQFDPINHGADPFTAAKASSTLKVLSVVLDAFGTGYTTAPAVVISDTGAGTGSGAAATATTDFGAVTALNLVSGGSGYITPGGIKKFVDGLPGLTPAGSNNLGQYIPIAQPDTTTFANADYYVIAVVQHREQMSSSLPPTLLREYVQLSTSVVPGAQIALMQDNLDGSQTAILMPDGTPALGVDNPHYLGPTIVATKDRAVRIVFYNLLPTGAGGDLFLPTDTSMMGAGMTPGAMAPVNEGTVTDLVRNPMCTGTASTMSDCFQQNRATLHLHGGVTPWISDGTPHQWITPANETTPWPQGVSVQNVPDMVGASKPAGVPDCSAATDGCETFYYTNEQSARLMFYHDHAWGITRLNVYAGEAAGYLLTDATEQKLIGTGGALESVGLGTPLVIQDRTFVPSAAQLAGEDPTWDATQWGGMGDLWYHHVYMPAQNPGDPSGMSAYGRWMYGPWFWPPATPVNGPIANPYYQKDPAGPDGIIGVIGSPDAADDFTTRLATACNLDVPATWQYQVAPFCEPEFIPGTPNISVGMEQFNDTPIVNGTAYPTTTVDPKAYRFRILNAANDRFWNLQWYLADNQTPGLDTEVALDPVAVAAAQTDINIFPTPDTTKSPVGPSWIQIGTEGGFLPAPTVVPNQPITWITDPTRFDVGNVDKHSLVMGPAERADVIVDFSMYAGKTLILYNDAPAAYPARVASYDYYTGGPDGLTLPGYGPNTRTVMQVKVAANPPAPAFNMTALTNAFKHHADGSGVFESSQDPIIVGQAAYNSAYGKAFVASGDCSNPDGTNKCDGQARIAQQGGQQFRFDTLKGPQLKVNIEPKALHDEMNSAAFDEYGRMTANLGLEAVPATPAGQNILLYPYVAPPTEVIDGTNLPQGDINVQAISSGADGTQIWKITHNGVDTHPIHFHLFNVQLLNRVTWDGINIPTEASELGWKETIRVSPLEDTIVALRPIVPTLPFEIPNSIRHLNPMMMDGENIDPTGLIVDPDGNISTIRNALVNFGWEYVYHCHILSHEEMDMMRPVLLAVPPVAPGGLVFDQALKTLTFSDNSITETSFIVQKSPDGTTWTDLGAPIVSPLDQPNIHQSRSIIDADFNPNLPTYYRVVALNKVGYGLAYPEVTAKSMSAPLLVGIATTTTLTSDVSPSLVGQTVTFTATVTGAGGTPTGPVQFSIDGTNVATVALNPSGVATYATNTLTAGSHPVVATYSGVLPYGGSFGSLTQTVIQATTATTLISSLNPSLVGDNVTFTATVSNLSGAAVPTGSVDFKIDGVLAASVPLDPTGVAMYATATLAAGTYTVTADYLGNAAYIASAATPLIQVVTTAGTATSLVSSLNPSLVGDNVTFTATVRNTFNTVVPTGSVNFSIDGAPVATVALDPTGVAMYSTATLAAGTYAVTADYVGNATFIASSATPLSQVVDKTPTTTVVVSSLNPSVAGQSVTFTATVSPLIATGTVQFSIDGVLSSVPLVAGQASLSTSALTVGAHLVIATYSGDPAYLASTSATLTQSVGPALRATNTVVTSNRVPSANLGQNITFTATVRPVTGAGIPAGTVQFSIDGTNVGGVLTLNAQGRATYGTSTLAAGTHTVIATYSGSAIFAGGGSATFVQVVNQAASTTVVTSNTNPARFGQSVTFTARVTPAAAAGTVQFTIDGSAIGGPMTLDATGRARLVLNSLLVGSHTISAAYSGSTNYLASTSVNLTQTVNKANSRTVVTTSGTPALLGTTVVFTATVTAQAPGAGIPTGTVQFRIDGVNAGAPMSLNGSGQAGYLTSTMTRGRHTVTAVYSGDAGFNTSTSGNITQRIN